MNPKISVFIPYYNDELFLRESVESVLNQTFREFELILLNHASTDTSRKIARSFKDQRIKHIDMKINIKGGGGLLLIEALKIAKGEFFKPFCADDIMLPHCLEVLYKTILDNTEMNLCFSDKIYINANGNNITEFKLFNNAKKFKNNQITWVGLRPNLQLIINESKNSKIHSKILLKKYLDGISLLPWISSLVKTDILRNIKIDTVLKLLIDMTIWIQVLLQSENFLFINQVLCKYRVHDKQVSGSDDKKKIDWKTTKFESSLYPEYFAEYLDVKHAKEILESDFSKLLTSNDEELVPFVVSHHFMYSKNQNYNIYAIRNIYHILQNKELYKKIENKFNFGTKDLREIVIKSQFMNIEKLSTKELLLQLRKKLILNVKRNITKIKKILQKNLL